MTLTREDALTAINDAEGIDGAVVPTVAPTVVLRALSAAGFALVPREPTEEMLAAAIASGSMGSRMADLRAGIAAGDVLKERT